MFLSVLAQTSKIDLTASRWRRIRVVNLLHRILNRQQYPFGRDLSPVQDIRRDVLAEEVSDALYSGPFVDPFFSAENSMKRLRVRALFIALATASLAPRTAWARDLTFEDRVKCQEAIERVY